MSKHLAMANILESEYEPDFDINELTPEMVQGLQQNGITFRNTQDVWRGYLQINGMYGKYQKCPNNRRRKNNLQYIQLPAPNLKECIKKLPYSIFVDNKTYHINMMQDTQRRWVVGYYDFNCISLCQRRHPNLLVAVYLVLNSIKNISYDKD